MAEVGATVLAGDIGGTNTRLGLFDASSAKPRTLVEQTFSSRDAGGLEDIVAGFVADRKVPAVACLGIAGPVVGRRVRATNLPWVVDAGVLEDILGGASVVLINDLEATAWGVGRLGRSSIATLNPGRDGARGNGAVIAAGTGLGEAGLFWDGGGRRPFACEGGHASFSPTDEVSDRLLAYLRQRFETVSWERVLSGPGFVNLYRFLLEDAGRHAPDWFADTEGRADPAPLIVEHGLDGDCEIAVEALRLFVRLYGEEAGNLALKLMATGGVWVGGGVAPKILPALQSGAFMEGFLAKGRMRPLMQSMPVHVVLDDRTALLGAAHRAALEL